MNLSTIKAVELEACLKRGHAIYETFNGLAWCRRCHERTDKGFAVHSKGLLMRIKNEGAHPAKDISCDEMTKKSPDELYPSTYTISLGSTTIAQKRRATYEKAAAKAGASSLGEWMREILDASSSFNDEK